jgi:hypothetical protein
MNIEGVLTAIPTMDTTQRKAVRRNAEALLVDPSKQAAARTVLDALDAETTRAAAAVAEQFRLIPIGKRVADVFSHKPPTESERKAVQVLLDNPASPPERLSSEIGWKKPIWKERFIAMVKKREAGLWPPDEAVVRDDNFYSSLIADITADGRWTMRPDVVQAFIKLGITARSGRAALPSNL